MDRRLLLAGSVGPERVPARPGGEDPRWFEPLHVRREVAARERIALQVAAGADVVVAPTWLSHRRALLPAGETRSARAWTAAAVRVARDGVELGLEQRESTARDGDVRSAMSAPGEGEAARGEAAGGEADGRAPVDRPPSSVRRPDPLVAASLPALDAEPEPGSGRLLPREAATARDYRDQAGLLADAEPDVILVEGQETLADTRMAVEEAVATGIPTWVAAAAGLASENGGASGLARWTELCRQLGAEVVLVPPPASRAADIVGGSGTRWGGLIGTGGSEDATRAWLEAGGTVIGLLDGAAPATLAPVRYVIDRHERIELEAHEQAAQRWRDHLARAAAMAPGGAALWLGDAPDGPLPDGFDWLVVDAVEAAHLPIDHFRLVVSADPSGEPLDVRAMAAHLERGGILVTTFAEAIPDLADLRVLAIDAGREPVMVLLRRED